VHGTVWKFPPERLACPGTLKLTRASSKNIGEFQSGAFWGVGQRTGEELPWGADVAVGAPEGRRVEDELGGVGKGRRPGAAVPATRGAGRPGEVGPADRLGTAPMISINPTTAKARPGT
jgi:hypothetical protein